MRRPNGYDTTANNAQLGAAQLSIRDLIARTGRVLIAGEMAPTTGSRRPAHVFYRTVSTDFASLDIQSCA
jgi:hypothetical protein